MCIKLLQLQYNSIMYITKDNFNGGCIMELGKENVEYRKMELSILEDSRHQETTIIRIGIEYSNFDCGEKRWDVAILSGLNNCKMFVNATVCYIKAGNNSIQIVNGHEHIITDKDAGKWIAFANGDEIGRAHV